MTDLPESSDGTQSSEGYIIDAENAAEMARLMLQDRLFTKELGLVPETLDPTEVSHVLDIACGPGGWLLDLTTQYPHISGVGVDISQLMIDYANSLATAQEVSSLVQFQVMDVTQPLPFPESSFDLVNARLIGFLSPTLWPKVVKEMLRVTSPGGTIRLTETEMSVSTSPALEQEHAWFFQSLWRAGQSFSPTGQRLNITAQLAPLLRQSGCLQVYTRAYGIEWSTGTDAHQALSHNATVGFKLMEPFYLATGVATQEEMDQTYTQMLAELDQPDFTAVQYLFSAWGVKALDEKTTKRSVPTQ